MKGSIFALAVLAVAVPGFALAGDPVPMNDKSLDAVVAGQVVPSAVIDQIVRDPNYPAAIQALRGSPAAQNQVKTVLQAVPARIISENDANLRRVLPQDLQFLIPKTN